MKDIKRIFLITVDCLRADHVGCIGGGDLTPNIDKIASEGTVFTRAFSNGPATTQSFTAILTSTYFLMHNSMRLSPYYTTLAEVLRSNGFKTVAFHSNPFLSKILGWDKGFSEFYDFMDEIRIPSAALIRSNHLEKIINTFNKMTGIFNNERLQSFLRRIYYKVEKVKIPYVEGIKITDRAIKWIERHREEKFFFWIHYMDSHRPYVPHFGHSSYFTSREEALIFDVSIHNKILQGSVSARELELLKGLYRGEVEYVDQCIGKLTSSLERLGLLEDSLIIITADHGEPFMEHERIEHNYDVLYNEAIHVPLIFYGLDDFPGKLEKNVQLIDLPATILDVLDIKKPKSFMGNTLFQTFKEKNNVPIFTESSKPNLTSLTYDASKIAISCIVGKWKLIINEFWGITELYNIKKDFQERNNLIDEDPEKAQELMGLIKNHLANIRKYRMKIKIRKKSLKFMSRKIS